VWVDNYTVVSCCRRDDTLARKRLRLSDFRHTTTTNGEDDRSTKYNRKKKIIIIIIIINSVNNNDDGNGTLRGSGHDDTNDPIGPKESRTQRTKP